MKRFIAISLLLLVGFITTVAASPPPGLNSKLNVTAIVLPDQAELQTIFAQNQHYTMIPIADARAGCTLGIVEYTVNNYQLQAEFRPMIVFDIVKTEVERTCADVYYINKINRFENIATTINLKVCGRARNAVMGKLSSDRYHNWQADTIEVLQT